MTNNNKKLAGLWLDNAKAIFITNNEATDNEPFAITDKYEAEKFVSDRGEHSQHEGEKTKHMQYFKAVAKLLLNYDEIMIFGTGKAQEQFQNFLKEDSHFRNKKISIDSAQQMTDHQMVAKVRDYFKASLS